MLDVGGVLAHLHRMSWFGNGTDASGEYYKSFRLAVLDQFGGTHMSWICEKHSRSFDCVPAQSGNYGEIGTRGGEGSGTRD